MNYRITALFVALLTLVSAMPAGAQSTPAAPQTSDVPPTAPPQAEAPPAAAQPPGPPVRHMNTTWQDGLVIESDDSEYRIQMGAFIRADGRFVPDGTAATVPNTFLMRTL